MTSIGETLRRERVRRNFDLEAISKELKIPARLLEAIEAEQFEKLPGGVFAKSFVRQYAKMLGLDEEEIAAELDRQLRPEPEEPLRADVRADGSHIPLPRMEEWQSVSDRKWPKGGAAGFLPSAVLVVVVMLLCSALYALWQRAHRPTAAVVAGTSAAKVTPTAMPPGGASAPPAARTGAGQEAAKQAEVQKAPEAGKAEPTATPAADEQAHSGTEATAEPAQPKPAVDAPAASAAAAPAGPPAAMGAVHVELKAAELTWIWLQADGKYVYSGTLDPNQSRTVDANGTILLRTGNAGGLEVTLNGKPVGSLGPKGQVRNVQFTSGGFQILAPPPKPPAPAPEPL